MEGRIISIGLPLYTDCCNIFTVPPKLKKKKKTQGKRQKKVFVKASADGYRASSSEK